MLAGPPGTGYRVRKFVRRHRGAVGAAAAIVSVLVVGLIVTTRLYVRESRALEPPLPPRPTRGSSATTPFGARRRGRGPPLTDESDRFLRSMFDSIDPDKARGKPVLVKDVLDAAVEKLDGAFPDRPAVTGTPP